MDPTVVLKQAQLAQEAARLQQQGQVLQQRMAVIQQSLVALNAQASQQPALLVLIKVGMKQLPNLTNYESEYSPCP